MHIETNGLVIAAHEVREGDCFLTVLSDSEGKIKVNARGALRRRSRLAAVSQLFAYSRLSLFEKDGRYQLDSGAPICQFYGLSKDVTRLALAAYFASLLEALTEAGSDSSEPLHLAVAALYVLSESDRPEKLVKAAFELRLAAMSGYAPELYECALCGEEPSSAFFDPEEGRLICGRCAETGGRGLLLTPGALAAMRFVLEAELRRLFSFSLGEESADILARTAESYILRRAERGFQTLDFYKSLSLPLKEGMK